MSNSCKWIVLASVLLFAGRASASTDINGLFDARSHGMGGTGVAYITSAGAIPINPALLEGVAKLSVTLDVFAIGAQPQAPYSIWHLDDEGEPYKSYDTIRSDTSYAPLPFLGAAYRLHPRVVLGIAAYPVIGQGTAAKYRPAPDEFPDLVATNKASMGLIETGEALSVRILDNLSIGLMWRITYMTQSVSTPLAGADRPPGVVTNPSRTQVDNVNIDVTGLNFYGFQFGVLYKPVPSLSLGFTYRNKVEVWGDGFTTGNVAGRAIKFKTESGFTNPHSIRAGLAYSALSDKLLLALDFKYLFYAEAFKRLKTVVYDKGDDMPPTINYSNQYWKNSAVLQLGAEYKTTDWLAVRAGYTVLNSATRADYAIAFGAPPGISHLICGGLGFKALDSLDLDIAGSYVVLEGRVDTKTKDNAGPGLYASHGGMISLSATYHR